MLAPGDSDQDRIPNNQFVSTTLPQIDYREFVLGKLIGSGAFGKVYRASMQAGDVPVVAVKFLRKTFWTNNDAKQSFLREIEQASQIDHESIIRYLGWGQSPHGGPYVIAQWIDGVTLAERRSVSPEIFIRYLEQICDALQAVHDVGIIHGDLTPNNILVNDFEHLWITDFGFSRSRINHDDVADHQARIESPLGGTLGFAAPEQVSASFGRIGRKTDIYAIGGLAYWYLTGRPPHDEGSIEATLGSTVSSADVDSASLPTSSTATQAIKRIAARTLQKTIIRRPESIGELRKLL
jgi:serine/threonine protein kinase